MEVFAAGNSIIIVGYLFVSVDTPNGVFRYEWGSFTSLVKEITREGKVRYRSGGVR